MAYAFLANLVDSFGSVREGPDLDSLEGLLQYLRQSPQESQQDLIARLRDFQERADQTRHSRQQLLTNRQQQLNPGLLALVNENLDTLEVLVRTLESLTQGLEAGEETLTPLDAVAQAAENYRANSLEIAELSHSQVPLCPRCGSSGAEPICPDCQLDRLLPDPMPDVEFQPDQLNADFQAIHQGYTAVLEGQLAFSTFLPLLLQFEAQLEQASNDALEASQSEPEHPAHPLFFQVYQGAQQAVRRMIGVSDHLRTQELHQGWSELAASARELNEAYAKIQEYEEEEEDDPNWSQDDFDEEILAHLDEED